MNSGFINPGAGQLLRENRLSECATAADRLALFANLGISTPLFVLAAKNIPILTAGAPADLTTIAVPNWVARWKLQGGLAAGTSLMSIMAESAAGTLAAAQFEFRDALAGGGNLLNSGVPTGPAAAGQMTTAQAQASVFSTAATLVIRQTTASANAGNCSFYFVIFAINP